MFRRREISHIVTLTLAFGLLAGLLESVVFIGVRRTPWFTWEMRQLDVSYDYLWIAPLVDVVIFGAATVFIATAAMLLRAVLRRDWPSPQNACVFGLATLTVYIALQVPGRLYRWAALALAIGIATRVFALYRRVGPSAMPLARRSAALLGTVVCLLALALSTATAVSERLWVQKLPDAAPAPNVLLVVLDTVRADRLSAYGYPRSTSPQLERLAREGVTFDHAMATSSWTLPSHASLFTGRYVHAHGADSERPVLGTDFPTLAEVFSARGFVTGGFSANTTWATRNTGLARGFGHFEEYFHPPADAVFRTIIGREFVNRAASRLGHRDRLGRRAAPDVTARFLNWLDAQPKRPFFAFLNYFDAHGPYLTPEPYHSQFMDARQRAVARDFSFRVLERIAARLAPFERSLFSAAYDGGLSYVDSELGRLVEELRRRGQLDHTLIVIVGDHGEALGEHGAYGHGFSLYAEQLHVPLVVRLPGTVPAGVRVTHAVSIADIPATIMAAEGWRADSPLPGRSLDWAWSGPGTDDNEAVLSEVGHHPGAPPEWPVSTGWLRSLVTSEWKLILSEDGAAELYRLTDDPGELRNRATLPGDQAILAAMREALAERIESR